jgi:hypothetical protein
MLPKRKNPKKEIKLDRRNLIIGSSFVVRLKNKHKVKFKKTIKTIKDIINFKNGLFYVFIEDQDLI